MPSVVEDIIHSYTHNYDESKRLSSDIGPLEAFRTRELLRRFLPTTPAVVCDVGGATGPYAFWLASLGYTVHLLDLVPLHIEKARAMADDPTSPRLASIQLGDARQLPFDEASADAVILHGPLYHLPDLEDRMACLLETKRVLRPGGMLLAFGITRYAGLIYAITKGLIFDHDYRAMIAHEVQTGRRRRSATDQGCFKSAYFHLPTEMEQEARAAGLEVEHTWGILGPSWQVPDLEESWNDPARREVILEMARLTEHEPLLGPRFVTVCRK